PLLSCSHLARLDLHVRSMCSFFFQAEGGIRDLVRSRGLGLVMFSGHTSLGAGVVHGALIVRQRRAARPN
ncbi:hypothetical protein GAY28_30750, partial [Azospirillum brasilense]|nr:hypothetical protein [Azospirillum brasilense]